MYPSGGSRLICRSLAVVRQWLQMARTTRRVQASRSVDVGRRPQHRVDRALAVAERDAQVAYQNEGAQGGLDQKS